MSKPKNGFFVFLRVLRISAVNVLSVLCLFQMGVDVVGHHARDLKAVAVGGNFDGLVVRVFRDQKDLGLHQLEALADQVAPQLGHDDGTVRGLEGPVHQQEVAGKDTRSGHGIARHTEAKGGGLVLDQVFIQVQAFFDVVVGGGEGSGGNPR